MFFSIEGIFAEYSALPSTFWTYSGISFVFSPPTFIDDDKSLTQEELGWSKHIQEDAQSDNPETIFRYIVEIVGLNILFYWMKDRQWYTIETEKSPIEVRRIFPNPNWDGKCEYLKAGKEGFPQTCSEGEVLATFDEPIDIWDNLKIDNVPIGEVLKNSVISDLD